MNWGDITIHYTSLFIVKEGSKVAFLTDATCTHLLRMIIMESSTYYAWVFMISFLFVQNSPYRVHNDATAADNNNNLSSL